MEKRDQGGMGRGVGEGRGLAICEVPNMGSQPQVRQCVKQIKAVAT